MNGRSFVTHCPWHDDRHPSLSVSPQRNRVQCFVCQRGADPIGWIQDRQGLNFPEAVRELARRYAIPIPEEDPQAAATATADLQADGPAAAYLQERGITPQTAIDWQLGRNGDRLMLPLRDAACRCVAFSGRSLTGEMPKYRNSSADALFRKSELLFGLDRAATAIRRSGEVVLVEGPLDAIQLNQAGIETADAAMGTALSLQQQQLLQRHGARRFLLAFDGDAASRMASRELIRTLLPLTLRGDLELEVVPLPEGADPDDLLRQEGAEAFRERLGGAEHWLAWELEQLLAPITAQPEDLTVLQRVEREAAQLLALLPVGPLRHRAEERLRGALGAVPQILLEPGANTAADRWIRRHQGSVPAPPHPATHHEPTALQAESNSVLRACTGPLQRAEWRALRLILCCPSMRELLASLVLPTPRFSRALSCLRVLNERIPQDPAETSGPDPMDPLVDPLRALTPRLESEQRGLLEDLLRHCGSDVRRMLARDPWGELQTVLDWLEPVELQER